jgi:uncharacterized membrane protein YkvI
MSKPTWLQRTLLPGFAFKAVIIGGGYATGRELAEFFGPEGARGGLYGMLLAMAVWSLICASVFVYAQTIGARDYRNFFRHLLGSAWPVFEILLAALLVLMLAVFSAAAGAIGHALFGFTDLVGQLVLIGCTMVVVAFGSESVERLFKTVSLVLYATYALFIILALASFGGLIENSLAQSSEGFGWIGGGLAYSGYNAVGAVLILTTIRHLPTGRDAAIAGLLCGPLAMIPAMLFFLAMSAFPEAALADLPSDFLLGKIGLPWFHFLFQFMIFLALLESSVGCIHAINERIVHVYERDGRIYTPRLRSCAALLMLVLAGFGAQEFGLIALISYGYRFLSYGMLAVFVLPMLTIGLWRLWRWHTGALMKPATLAT